MKIRLRILFFLYLAMGFQLILAAPITVLSWEMMAKLNDSSGKIPDSLKQFNHQMVDVSGFIVPLEMDYDIEMVKDFLLVPDPLACIHVPPPPPNQMILVKMESAIPLDMDLRGVAIQGILTISKAHPEDDFFSYQLSGISAKEANIEFEYEEFEYEDFEYDGLEQPVMEDVEYSLDESEVNSDDFPE